MKTILAITLGTILLVGALENPAHSNENVCKQIGETAAVLMDAKYVGLPISQLIETMHEKADVSTHKMLTAMILAAYSRPNYSSDEYQKRETAIFRNEIEMECYRREGK